MSAPSRIWHTILAEFSDIADLEGATIIVVRLCLAMILGAAIGYERELRGKDAGLRTHMLVTLGAALFTLVPATSGMDPADTSRVIQGIVAGIGFLGAGAILKQGEWRDGKSGDGREVKGLTTAASIWVAAAIGVAVGYGREATAVVSTLIALFVLAIVRRLEK
ncbi:MAG TPA: MgtC/SapB family protein [Burkholderiaceae bacterium]|nr:MgtC/SapB family protein [Burkholderiaceae bacterium]